MQNGVGYAFFHLYYIGKLSVADYAFFILCLDEIIRSSSESTKDKAIVTVALSHSPVSPKG